MLSGSGGTDLLRGTGEGGSFSFKALGDSAPGAGRTAIYESHRG